jgi:hypothetical protein
VKHHIVNRCQGGEDQPYNMLRMKEKRGKALHKMFGSQTLRSIYTIIKEVNIRIVLYNPENLDYWLDLFGDKTKAEALALLARVIRAKEAQRR